MNMCINVGMAMNMAVCTGLIIKDSAQREWGEILHESLHEWDMQLI